MVKKGKRNKIERDRLATLENLFGKFFHKRHKDEATRGFVRGIVEDMIIARKEWAAHVDALPMKFTKDYGAIDYSHDVRNVDLYYSFWKREDLWCAKDSLARLRKYEKREKLEPFDVLREKAEQETMIRNMSIKEGGCEH